MIDIFGLVSNETFCPFYEYTMNIKMGLVKYLLVLHFSYLKKKFVLLLMFPPLLSYHA